MSAKEIDQPDSSKSLLFSSSNKYREYDLMPFRKAIEKYSLLTYEQQPDNISCYIQLFIALLKA
ncbi:hypothetical protein [Metabacillus litoralis]|uniref:hypothetical protein n=1 Tax=Metabacillus litoralis TaxID=152268 RepID=UPI001CFE4000|nr:hypothetical protein [Metabacillus litoralis]